jgi:hypothetical protein
MLAWNRFRTEHSHNTRQDAELAEHWGKFLKLYNMFAISCTDEQKNAFLMRFLHSQMCSNIPPNLRGVYQVSYRVWRMNKWFFHKLKQTSLTRKLVCNLLGESVGSEQECHTLFQQSYFSRRIPFYKQKLMFLVLRRLISFIAYWHQLSVELNH